MKTGLFVGVSLIVMSSGGCMLKEVRAKTKFGPEFRHSGTKNTNRVRYSVQQGMDFKWTNGTSTGITYRRRDDDDGGGNNDNGV